MGLQDLHRWTDGKPKAHTHTHQNQKTRTQHKSAVWTFCQWGTRQNVGKLAGRSRSETIRYCSQWSFMLPGGKYLFSMSARRGFTSTPFLRVSFLFSFLGKTSVDPDITSCIHLAYGSVSVSCPAKQRLTSSDGLRGSSLTSGKVSAQLVQRLCKKLKTSDLTSWSLIIWTGFLRNLKSTGGEVCPSLAASKSFSKRPLPECRLLPKTDRKSWCPNRK